MLDQAKNFARRLIGSRAKGILRGRWFPMLLPHHQLVGDGISTLGGPVQYKSTRMLQALHLCDGTRTLAEVARLSGAAAQALIDEEDADTILLWPDRPKLGPERGQGRTEGIILSPHLDDAALSVGSMMLRAAEHTPLLVVDVFSKVSWWRYPLSDGILTRVQTTRDAEEKRVMLLTNCALRRWEFGEAPLRGYPLKEIFTAERLPEATEMHRKIRERVRELAMEKPHERWYLPLGVGNHIDHRIARDAAIAGLRQANVAGKDVRFYEDHPYAAQLPEIQNYQDFIASAVPDGKLEPMERTEIVPLKERLLRLYFSQLTRAQINSVMEYANRADAHLPCERLWGFSKKTLEATEGNVPAVVVPET